MDELKAFIAVTYKPSNDHNQQASIRSKRQAIESGDNLPVFDRAYGVDLKLKVIGCHFQRFYELLS